MQGVQGAKCDPSKETIISVACMTYHRLANCLRLTRMALGRLRESDDPKDPVCKEPEGSSLEDIARGLRALAGQIDDALTQILDAVGERMEPQPSVPPPRPPR